MVDEKSNIVRLTAAEHFKAHYWLFRHYKEIGDIPAMRKMSYALFRMKVQIFANCSDEQLDELAAYYEYVRIHKPPMSEESRKKISLARKGKPGHKPSKEAIERFRQMAKSKRSAETCKKISELKKRAGRWRGADNPKYGRGDEVRGSNNGMWGRHRTTEEKQHLSKCNSRPVAVFKDGVLFGTFPSVKEAQNALGVFGIGSMITGLKRNTTPYTFKHITAEEYENGK